MLTLRLRFTPMVSKKKNEADRQREVIKKWQKEDPEIDRYKICPKCNGLGEILKRGEFITCPKCDGERTIKK